MAAAVDVPACATNGVDPLYAGVYTPACVPCLPDGNGGRSCVPEQCFFVYGGNPEFERDSQSTACGTAHLCLKAVEDPADPAVPKVAVDDQCPAVFAAWFTQWAVDFVCSPHCPQEA